MERQVTQLSTQFSDDHILSKTAIAHQPASSEGGSVLLSHH